METVGSTEHCTISIDRQKNRIFLVFIGDILDPKTAEPIPGQTQKGCEQLKPGFTCLADFTQMRLLSLGDLAAKVQSTLLRADVKKVASVWSEDTFAKMVVDRSGEKVGSEYASRRKHFTDRTTAEKWLDE